MAQIKASNFKFLKDLAKNNDRDWFTENKKRYQSEHEEIIDFADALLVKMNEHDLIETPTGKKSLYRIYRDVRFSKDKSPYKTHWAGGFKRATKHRRGGYFFHLKPGGESFIAGGFWAPNKDDLQRIREEIATDATELRAIVADPKFVSTFGTLDGEQLKTSPKGFDKEHPNVDLLRYKQFIFSKNFSDKEVLSADFADVANETFKAMRPFFDFMSDVLTTNSNGETYRIMQSIYYDEVSTPLGNMQVGITEKGISMFEFPIQERIDMHKKKFSESYTETTSVPKDSLEVLKTQMNAFFKGDRTQFDLPIDLVGTDFQCQVWKALMDVPFGKTISYLALAENLGNPKGVRAVAQANGQNRIPIIVPCHRIIASNGKLTGYSGELWRKEILLSKENGQGRLTF